MARPPVEVLEPPATSMAPDQSVELVLPLRVDSSARLENLAAVLAWLVREVPWRLSVHEQGADPRARQLIARVGGGRVSHATSELGAVFHKSRLINGALRGSAADIVGYYDVDVLLTGDQLRAAAALIGSGRLAAALPYDGRYYDVAGTDREQFLATRSVGVLSPERATLVWADTLGGAALFARPAFEAAGMMNERCRGWGPEDREVIERLRGLGHRVGRVRGPLWHLSHPRGPDSRPGHASHADSVRQWELARDHGRDAIAARVRSWSWLTE